jgi:hypothetical protein
MRQSIYTVGGTVQAENGIYITRQADQELLTLCRNCTFAYLLTPRQMGKSSLMVQTASQLQQEGICTITIDLQSIGTQVNSAEQWYLGLLTEIEDQLNLDVGLVDWWEEQPHLGLTQRMTRFFSEVVLAEIEVPIVVFVDEIDTTLGLDFTDDFFIAIRYFYTARAQNPEFNRLSFVLIGVATPADLIRDPHRTPFNVGQRVDLTDFSHAEALPLAQGLGLPESETEKVLKRVLDWTGGHPYLTQRLCQAVRESIEEKPEVRSNRLGLADIDRIVASTFFGGMSERDNNLQFVQAMLTQRAPDLYQVLTTYKDIWRGRQPIEDEEQSLIKSHLKLAGVVKRDANKTLQVRNAIYQQVFDEQWIRENLPINWRKRIRQLQGTLAAGALLLGMMSGLTLWAFWERGRATAALQIVEQERDRAETEAQRAEQAAGEASKSFIEAERQRQAAEYQQTLAEQRQETAETAEAQAEARRREAETARRREAAERQAAEVAREQAERSRQAEVEQRELARQQRERAEANAEQARMSENIIRHTTTRLYVRFNDAYQSSELSNDAVNIIQVVLRELEPFVSRIVAQDSQSSIQGALPNSEFQAAQAGLQGLSSVSNQDTDTTPQPENLQELRISVESTTLQRSSEYSLQIGLSSLTSGDSIRAEEELRSAFEQAKSAAGISITSRVVSQELLRQLNETATYYAWNRLNYGYLDEAESILEDASSLSGNYQGDRSAVFLRSLAILENAFSRLALERDDKEKALEYQRSSIEYARRAVSLETNNAEFSRTLAVYLRNLSNTSASLMSEEEADRYEQEGCEIARAADQLPDAGTVLLDVVVSCAHDESFEGTPDQIIEKLLTAKARLDAGIQSDPANIDFKLSRAWINARLIYVEKYLRQDPEAANENFRLALSDWLNVIGDGDTFPTDVWKLRAVYFDLKDHLNGSEDLVQKERIFEEIVAAVDPTYETFGDSPDIALIGADSALQLGELQSESKPAESRENLNKAIERFPKTRILEDTSTYSERYTLVCNAHEALLRLDYEVQDVEAVVSGLENIQELCLPIFEQYRFDFYLHAEIRSAHQRAGELLFEDGQYERAKPILEYASYWGVRESSELLARMYREGLGVPADSVQAGELEVLASWQSMKRFTIPANFGDNVTAPFHVYVYQKPDDYEYRGIDDQVEWLKQARGGTIADDVTEAFRKLQDIASENKVSFPELAAYAVGRENSENSAEAEE